MIHRKSHYKVENHNNELEIQLLSDVYWCYGCKILNWHDPAYLTSCGLCLEIGQFSYLLGFTIALLHPPFQPPLSPRPLIGQLPRPWPLIGWHWPLTNLGRAGSSVRGSRLFYYHYCCPDLSGKMQASVIRQYQKCWTKTERIQKDDQIITVKTHSSTCVVSGRAWGRDDVGDVMMRWGEMTWLLLMDHPDCDDILVWYAYMSQNNTGIMRTVWDEVDVK